MTTCADLIDDTRSLLFSGKRENMNSLNGALDASTTTVTLGHALNQINEGASLSIDLEIMYVWSISGSTATVQRGMLGSTAVTHADGALVYVNSQFPAFNIFKALNADLDDLSSPQNGLFQLVTEDFDYNPAIQGYDLAAGADVLNVLAVRAQFPGPSKDWAALDSYRLDQNADTGDFASGFSITLYEGGSAGLPIRVTYSAPFTHFTALTTNVTTTGLPASAYDIPPLGAGMRLTGVREVQRNATESQGDTRRASEVPPNAQLAGYQALARERQRRIRAESAKLASSFPMKRRGL